MLRQFIDDDGGNLALIFAFLSLMLIAGVGTAIDFAGANRMKSNYQDLADAAVLAAIKVRPSDEAEMDRVARATIETIAARNKADPGERIETNFSDDEKVLQVRIHGRYTNLFMGVFGHPSEPLSVLSETVIEFTEDVEIALVLDTTGSMDYNGRLTSLKNSANKFVNAIEETDPGGRVRIGVVPFAQYVNVGTSVRGEDWLNVPPDYQETFAQQCRQVRGPKTGEVCETRYTSPTPGRPAQPARPAVPATYGTCTDDGVEYRCQTRGAQAARPYKPAVPPKPGGELYEHCEGIYGPDRTECSTPSPRWHRWNGCVGSRDGNANIDYSYSLGEAKVPGYLNLTCGQQILPLTTNFGAVRSKINGLTADGSTYSAAGLIWGHRLVTAEAPFPAKSVSASGEAPRRVVIFMSDGANTKSRSGFVDPGGSPPNTDGKGNHENSNRNQADRTSQDVCDAMKSDPTIEVYTISFEVEDKSAKSLVEDCATNREMYFDAANSHLLEQAFDEIALSLMSQRLTQ